MPICRYQIRAEYGSADPELYRAADRDDPEAILEGVAMAGLVGFLRQLGDLAEFAAGIFHDLHEEVMATAARGHGLMHRVQQLEEELPSIEKSFLSETNYSQVASSAGLDWHANLRMDQNLVASGDLPRFVMDSYEECRGPPRLFLLDKFDVAGVGSCLKRYSDPSFFKTEFASSGKMKVDAQREKKVRKIKRKGMRYKIGDTPDFFSASEFSSRMQDLRANEPHNVSGKSSMHGVKLKRRNLFDYSFNSIKRSYMEQIFKIHSPEQKPVYESSLVHSSWRRNSGDSSELHSEVYEIHPMDSAIKQTHMEHTDLVIMPSTTGKYGHDLARGDSLCGPLELVNESETMDEIATFPAFSPKDVVVDGYKSDGNTSEMENFVDALTTMESELETDVENRLKHEKSILSFPIRGMDSDSIDEPVMLQAHLSDSQSVGNSSASYEWNKICKKKGSSPSSSDRLSNVEEPLPSAICYDKIHEPSFRRILTDGDTVEDNPSFLHVEYQNDILNLPVQVPNEASPGFCSGDSTSEHILTSPGLLDSPHTSSTFDEDHTIELLPSSGEVGQHLFVGSQNSSSMSSVIHSTVEDAQTLGFVGAAPGKEDPAKVSCDGDSEEKNKEILDLSRKLEGNISHDKSPASHFEDNVSANLVNSLSDPSVLLSEMTEYKQKLVERKPYVLLGKDASDQKHILHSSPHIAPISVKPHELDMVSIDDVFLSTKSEQSMNSLEKKENISMIEFEEVPEQAVADFNSNPSIIKGKDSAPMLTATSAPIYVYEISSGPETVDSPLAQGNILKLDRCAVSEASVSLMHEKPENATANTHDTVGTDKTAVHFPPLQTDSDDCRPNFASTSVVSAGHNASSDECLRKITSYEHNLEMSELSSLESSSSFVNAVDSTIAFSPDTVVDQNKVEDVATPDAVKHEPDEFVIDRPLGGSTVMMPVTLNPDSDSEFVDFFSQPAAVGAYQSDVYQEEKEYLQHSGPFQAITYTPDAVPEQETGKGVSIGSSQEHSVVSETNEASPTCLQTLPKVFPEQESGAQRLEFIKEVLESSQETGKILKCSEEICEVPNAVPSNQILEDHFDPICDIHFEDSVAEASYFLPQPVTDSEEGCQQSQKAAIADGSKVPHHDEIPVSSVETDQISGPHLSDEGPHTNLEGAGEIDQISELHMSDKDPHENVEDAIPPSVHLYQVTEQNVDNREIANSSLLNSETKQALAQIVFELSSSESLHEHVNPIMSASIGFQEVPEQTVDDSKAKSSDHESEIVQSLTQMTPGQFRQLESSDLFQGLESNMINKTEINCSPSPAESEACIYLPSCLNVSSSNGALSSSDRALPSLGLPDVQSATQQSSDLDEVPPLPPRPPVQWIEGKLSDESSSSWADAGSSLSFSPPPGLSEDSSSHGAQTSEDIFQSAKPIVTVPTTKEADNAGEGVISFNPFIPPLIDNGLTQDGLLGVGTLHPSNPFASLGFEEPPQGSISTGEASAPVVQLTQTTADEKPWQALNSLEEDVRQAVSSFASTLSEENERPRSRMVLPRRKDPLIEAVAAHDRSKLRKVSDRVKSEIKPKMDDRNSLLEQIRTKSFNLKPAGPTRPIIQGPKTNLNVAAILEKANAIRQALAGSDDDNDDDDSWSDSC